jgi:hypothetical protein
MALIVCVDDIVVPENDDEKIQNIKKSLANEFEIEGLGSLKYFLMFHLPESRLFLPFRDFIW